MAASIPALITPEVLVWARALDSLSIEDVSANLKVKCEKIKAWETGESYPTINQAKNLAKYCRVPFVYFYLPDKPKKMKRLNKTDYRTVCKTGNPCDMSRELRWLLRDIEDRRDTMLSLYAMDEKNPVTFPVHIEETVSAYKMAITIRSLLELTPAKQKAFRKPEQALSYCVAKLEALDVLVFQAAKIETSEMRGLSVGYNIIPMIVLNRKDENSAKLFTLCHELAHIISRSSGICNDVSENSETKIAIEAFCNQAAGLALVPKSELLQNPVVAHIKKFGFEDSYVAAIARDFAVSREVIIKRLWDTAVITKGQYFEALRRYSDEYQAYKKKKKKGFLPPAMDKGTQVGKLYTQTVLSSFYNEKISVRDASGYLLNLGPKHFGKIGRWCY